MRLSRRGFVHQKVHVAMRCILMPQSSYMGTNSGPKYIPCIYMGPGNVQTIPKAICADLQRTNMEPKRMPCKRKKMWYTPIVPQVLVEQNVGPAELIAQLKPAKQSKTVVVRRYCFSSVQRVLHTGPTI